jgi:hypothetical protein
MKYMYWFFAALVVSVGVYFSTHFSVSPEFTPILALGSYSMPEDFGKRIHEELKTQIAAAPVILLGVTPNKIEDVELWRGFLEASSDKENAYQVIVVESMLPFVEIFKEGVHIQLKEELPRLLEGIQKARSEGLRVAIIAPHIYSTQVLKNNLADRLINEFKIDVLSLTVTKFPKNRNQEADFELKCHEGDSDDPSGTSNLGCLIRNIARVNYRKKMEAGKYSGLMDQTAPKDYLILFNN